MFYRDLHADETYMDEIRKEVNQDDTSCELQLEMPPLNIQPKSFVNKHFGPGTKMPLAEFKKGTTTLAFIYKPKNPAKDKGGIVVAVDSRASGGSYISTKDVMKILRINERMVATMAGGAADCQFWVQQVSKYCNLFELREGTPITVSAASKYFANVMYGYRNAGLSVGSMIAGVDDSGPALYLVENTGMRIKLPKYVSVGSGSLNAYGILDTQYKAEMTDAEALKLGRQAIMHATYRDGGSGGQCNVVHITSEGVKQYPPEDVSEMYYEFAQARGIDVYASV